MTWTCDHCNRTFKHRNQSHNCVKLDIAPHYAGKSAEVAEVCEKILGEIMQLSMIMQQSTIKGLIL